EYDEEVAKTASEIVQGAIDYYDAILRLFNWIRKNIKYDESLIYVSSVNTSPAYVLKSRKALCSGFSSLFVAFLRSVGIPARNVFGIAHSGKEMREHMCVDIYIPENGFVEFDPTYGQFGYVDASHIRLYADNTSNAVETVYSYEGNASILYSNYSFSYELINYSSSFDALESKAYLSKEIAACDDNVLLILEIKNPLNSYVLTSAMITKVKDLELVYGDEYSSVVIPPLSSKQIHYVFHTQKNLKPNALYINPILIFVFGAREINLNLTINPKITERTRLDEIIITQENVSIEKNILRADILISPNKTAFPTNIFLKLKNVGNTILKNVGLKINYSNISYNYDLGMFLITQEKEFKYQLEIPNETGSYKVNVYLEYANKTDHYESILIVKEKTLIDYLIYFINKVISKLLEFLGRKAY
ncbi:MAG: transglutaminase-like domain-containing protein, partial [Candidatus Nanoarchaeia archaeon]|nr:transglutaminase-like domain-containing protein [Candidatus Jingweiarchaeum tengchongense]